MDTQTFGSVVAMQFRRRPGMEFSDIVTEFDAAFQMVDARSRSLTWDCDDIAVIARDSVRVALGWLPPEDERGRWHLIVAVGAAPDEEGARIDPASFGYLADRIVERCRARLPFTAVLRGQAHQPVAPELIDTTFDLLRLEASDMPGDQRRAKKNMAFPDDVEAYADMFSEMAPQFARGDHHAAEVNEDAAADSAGPGLAARAAASVDPLRQALRQRAKPTETLRLTIHTVALSVLLAAPPLGAFMFTYTMLRDITPVAT
jgi:hypothetical protein